MSESVLSRYLHIVAELYHSGRDWIRREQNAYELHPRVRKLIEENLEPKDLRQLVLEWPHVSETDPTRIAYTQNEDKGERDIQTVTSIGKYLRRHFSSEVLPDHKIRDITAAAAATQDEIGFVYTVKEMIDLVQNGPRSCMQGPEWNVHNHPYNVYLPEYGWHMAYRKQGGEINGRCLCLKDGDELLYVRSYKRCPDGGYSESDERLNSWLEEQGYTLADEWPDGTKLGKIEYDGRILAPYVDGDNQNADDCGSHLEILWRGEYDLTETTGYVGGCNDSTCTNCGDDFNSDHGDHIWVGYWGEDIVCGSCTDDFEYVRGREGERYYIHENDVIYTIEGRAYDENYLDDNDIVELEDGRYTHMDNAVCDVNDEWHHVSDIGHSVVEIEEEIYGSRYAPVDEVWECATSGNTYHEDTEHVTDEGGNKHHPDHYEEPEDEDDEDEEEGETADEYITKIAAPAVAA